MCTGKDLQVKLFCFIDTHEQIYADGDLSSERHCFTHVRLNSRCLIFTRNQHVGKISSNKIDYESIVLLTFIGYSYHLTTTIKVYFHMIDIMVFAISMVTI